MAGRRRLLQQGGLAGLARWAGLTTAGVPLALRAQPTRPGASATAAASAALRQPQAIALMRHAEAPGVGDPPGWRPGDCATQRNLSERGRAQARAVGARLRGERIAVSQLWSSPWCRCLDTARLLDAGAAQAQATFGNAYVLSDQRDTLTAGARALLGEWRGPGVLLVVTHGENIQALTGYSPASAELVVVQGGSGTASALRVVGTLLAPVV